MRYELYMCNNLNAACKWLHRTLYLTICCTFSIKSAEQLHHLFRQHVFTLFLLVFIIATAFLCCKVTELKTEIKREMSRKQLLCRCLVILDRLLIACNLFCTAYYPRCKEFFFRIYLELLLLTRKALTLLFLIDILSPTVL